MTGHTIPKTLEIGILARNGLWSELYVTSLSPHSGPESIFMQSTQVSFYTLIPPLASSMMAPALPDIGVHFGITNPTLIALTLSIFLITFAIGPLLLAPLSEIYVELGLVISSHGFVCVSEHLLYSRCTIYAGLCLSVSTLVVGLLPPLVHLSVFVFSVS